MINTNQAWSFMVTFAPEVPVLSNFEEMFQLWIWVAHFDEDRQICPNMAQLWNIMTSNAHEWSLMIWNFKIAIIGQIYPQ